MKRDPKFKGNVSWIGLLVWAYILSWLTSMSIALFLQIAKARPCYQDKKQNEVLQVLRNCDWYSLQLVSALSKAGSEFSITKQSSSLDPQNLRWLMPWAYGLDYTQQGILLGDERKNIQQPVSAITAERDPARFLHECFFPTCLKALAPRCEFLQPLWDYFSDFLVKSQEFFWSQ